MKTPFYALAVLALALGASSCGTGYTELDAYNLGVAQARVDHDVRMNHNPHINEPDTVPSAHRKAYIWGYCEGWETCGRGGSK